MTENAEEAIAPGAPDRTATGKEHFEVLDGLRGTGALLVMLFHLQSMTVNWNDAKVVLHHAPLAVDFFFALSGFVIGYAYDDRWGGMTVRRFFALRLARLHPLVVLGMIVGVGCYLFDPFAGALQAAPLSRVLVAFALGLLLLPGPELPNRLPDTHPLNGPCWSLLQEYLGNIVYALVLRRLSTRRLGMLAIASGALLAVCATVLGGLNQGSGWPNAWMAPVRLCFPFVTGLWLNRTRHRLPRLRLGWGTLSVVLVAIMAFPMLPEVGGVRINGLFEAACVIVAFPLIVLAGSHSDAGRGMLGLCKASGRLSYPLYITHFPILFVWMDWIVARRPGRAWLLGSEAAMIVLVLAVAAAAYAFWDVPIRARLRPLLTTRTR